MPSLALSTDSVNNTVSPVPVVCQIYGRKRTFFVHNVTVSSMARLNHHMTVNPLNVAIETEIVQHGRNIGVDVFIHHR